MGAGGGDPLDRHARAGDWCLNRAGIHAPLVLRAHGRDVRHRFDVLLGNRRALRLGLGESNRRLQVPAGPPAVPGATTFLVLKLQVVPGGRLAASLLVNPDPLAPEPPPGAIFGDVSLGHTRRNPEESFDRFAAPYLNFVSTGAVTFDELRVATTLAGAAGHAEDRDEMP